MHQSWIFSGSVLGLIRSERLTHDHFGWQEFACNAGLLFFGQGNTRKSIVKVAEMPTLFPVQFEFDAVVSVPMLLDGMALVTVAAMVPWQGELVDPTAAHRAAMSTEKKSKLSAHSIMAT
jgi:hypothetical protein